MIANQILVKIMICQIISMTNFESKLIMPKIHLTIQVYDDLALTG